MLIEGIAIRIRMGGSNVRVQFGMELREGSLSEGTRALLHRYSMHCDDK